MAGLKHGGKCGDREKKRCDNCGAVMTRVRDRRFNSGYRWRCPNCEAA